MFKLWKHLTYLYLVETMNNIKVYNYINLLLAEGMMGMAMAGTAVMAVGGLVALGLALSKGKS